MRNISKDISDKIITLLNFKETLAIYIFGSYGTEYYEKDKSDIDIAWIVSTPIKLELQYQFKNMLELLLGSKVDLIVIQNTNKLYLLSEILQGTCISYSANYDEWFFNFIENNKEQLELLEYIKI